MLAKSGAQAEAARVYRGLLNLPSTVTDDQGLSFASYAALRLAESHASDADALARVNLDLESAVLLSPTQAYRWRSVLEWIKQSGDAAVRAADIESFPEPGVRVQVSKEGGIQPRWTNAGQRLMYFEPTTPGGRYLSVSITATGGQVEVSAPQAFGPQPDSGYSGLMEREYTFNVGPDGRLLTQCGTPACLTSEGPLTGPELRGNSSPPAR